MRSPTLGGTRSLKRSICTLRGRQGAWKIAIDCQSWKSQSHVRQKMISQRSANELQRGVQTSTFQMHGLYTGSRSGLVDSPDGFLRVVNRERILAPRMDASSSTIAIIFGAFSRRSSGSFTLRTLSGSRVVRLVPRYREPILRFNWGLAPNAVRHSHQIGKRARACILRMTCTRWTLTMISLMLRSAAIRLLRIPALTSAMIPLPP